MLAYFMRSQFAYNTRIRAMPLYVVIYLLRVLSGVPEVFTVKILRTRPTIVLLQVTLG